MSELKNLFEQGIKLDELIKISFKDEKNKLQEIETNINFNSEIKEEVLKCNKNIKILLVAETWCPYARVFIATLNKILKLNSNIQVSCISYGRGLSFLADILDIEEDDFVIPTAVVLDNQYNIIKKYIGYPIELNSNFDKIKTEFFNGKMSAYIIKELFSF